jgi:outer membrane protein OmpA-like peptidoglycan-associated protein
MRISVRVRRACAGFTAAALCAASAGCALTRDIAGHEIPVHAERASASVLAVLLGSSSQADLALLRKVILATARPGEHLVVISYQDGHLLYSAAAPVPPASHVPARPVEEHDPTSFQKARYQKALATWRSQVRADGLALRSVHRRLLQLWAADAANTATRAAGRDTSTPGRMRLTAAMQMATATMATLQQTGVRSGNRREIVVIGPVAVSSVSIPYLNLSGIGVIVANGTGAPSAGTALQAALLEAGASQTTVLSPATDGQLPVVARHGLGGATSYQLLNLRYGPAQYLLPDSASPDLARILYLLTVRYPAATASIDGFTDDIPVPGGNTLLSWRRADQVLGWLVRHGVGANRLHAVGLGAADPVAPNRPGGQPLDRRVVIVIEPGLPPPT